MKESKKGREFNIIYCDNWLNNNLPDKCAKFLICDPPFYRVKGDFDFIWKTREEYLKDVEKWAIECKRVLADNGTLLWYGSAKNIAYSQIIFDKHFNLINNLVWNKGSFMGLEESEGLRSFAPCTERILMYGSKAQDLTGLQAIEKEYIAPRNPFAIELRRSRMEKGVSINRVAEYGKFYGKVNHGGSVTNWEKGYNIPNDRQWKILCDNLPISRMDYKVLKYDHDTVKPETLTRALILTCSRVGDLVIVPFAGSGTECAMSAKENRPFIGFDIEKKYVDDANKRCSLILQQPELFTNK